MLTQRKTSSSNFASSGSIVPSEKSSLDVSIFPEGINILDIKHSETQKENQYTEYKVTFDHAINNKTLLHFVGRTLSERYRNYTSTPQTVSTPLAENNYVALMFYFPSEEKKEFNEIILTYNAGYPGSDKKKHAERRAYVALLEKAVGNYPLLNGLLDSNVSQTLS